jgi:hypothetical protein
MLTHIKKAIVHLENADIYLYFEEMDKVSIPQTLKPIYSEHKKIFMGSQTPYSFHEKLRLFAEEVKKYFELQSLIEHEMYIHAEQTNPIDSIIDENNPILIGLLFDVSMNNFLNSFDQIKDLTEFFEYILIKFNTLCNVSNSEDVLNKILVFMYAYGLSSDTKSFFNFANKLGLSNKKTEELEEGNVRDILCKTSDEENITATPNLKELNKYANLYHKSIKEVAGDVLGKRINLIEGLNTSYRRFSSEVKNKSLCQYPLLIIVSGGKISDGSIEDVMRAKEKFDNLNIQIACLYLDKSDVLKNKTLYGQESSHWTDEAKLLFKLSSTFKDDSTFYRGILDSAKEGKWVINKNPKLFFQINHSEMLESATNILLAPLKS